MSILFALTRFTWKRPSIGSILVIGALVSTACSDSADTGTAPGASVQFVVPSESASDWVSYSKQIAVVRILREEQMAVGPGVAERGEGHVPGLLTLRVEATLWMADGTRPAEGEIQAGSLGWTMHEGKLHPINPDLKIGGVYLVAFANFKSGLAPMRPISLAIVDGRVSSTGKTVRSSSGNWVGGLDGLGLDEVRKLLATAPRDPVASRYEGLAVEDQVAAVRQAKASAQ